MSKVKDEILAQSLKLFNERGLSQVSLRTIAEEMNRSVGNLQYHFKKREDIIVGLYFQLVEKIDKEIAKQSSSESVIHSFFFITRAISSSFYEYRFFLLDFNLIIRQHAEIRDHYKQLTQLRKEQFRSSIDVLIANKLMREELLPNEYKNLFKRIQILSDFWLSSASIQSKMGSKKVIAEYNEVINQTLFPYLTEKGREEYQSFKR